jgi:tripartite-type tricarboxylate transporter receptor subunit TctC
MPTWFNESMMENHMHTHIRALLAGLCLALGTQVGHADANWPTKPVTIVLPSTAGAASDVLTRAVAAELAKMTGQSFIIDNRPGAAGVIALQKLKQSAPDGYTLGYGNINNLAVNPALFR